jgi:molybdenum cofactor cytidylyltransferase
MKRIGAVILAAGASARLGQPKQLLRLNGEVLLRRIARFAIEARCAPVVVVLGAVLDPCRDVLRDLDTRTVVNNRWPEGIGSSISVGVTALVEADVDSALLAVCDQPRISADALRRLIESHPGHGITAARYAATLGTPAIFSRHYFPLLCELSGEIGAKRLIHQHESEVTPLDLPEAETDIDSIADWDVINSQ